MVNMHIPFVNLSRFYSKHKDQILELTNNIGQSGVYILGDVVEEFERDFADFCGVDHAISVGNGTDALALSLTALNVGKGDEVIIPANSFISTAGAVIEAGATPICVDVEKDQNISLESVKKAVSKKTKAIIVVHLNGNPARIDEIIGEFKDTNIKIIEDAAQSIGAEVNDKKTGSFGNCGCFSLHPLKNFHMFGDAGMVITNSVETAHKVKILRNHGLINRDTCEIFSRNSRLDALQASYGKYLLPHLDEWTDRVIEIAEYYNEQFRGYFYTPKTRTSAKSVFHNYVIQTSERNELSHFLKQRGIETKVHYPIPICHQPAWKKHSLPSAVIPIVERQKDEILSLPIYAELTDAEIEYIAESVITFFNEKNLYREAV